MRVRGDGDVRDATHVPADEAQRRARAPQVVRVLQFGRDVRREARDGRVVAARGEIRSDGLHVVETVRLDAVAVVLREEEIHLLEKVQW